MLLRRSSRLPVCTIDSLDTACACVHRHVRAVYSCVFIKAHLLVMRKLSAKTQAGHQTTPSKGLSPDRGHRWGWRSWRRWRWWVIRRKWEEMESFILYPLNAWKLMLQEPETGKMGEKKTTHTHTTKSKGVNYNGCITTDTHKLYPVQKPDLTSVSASQTLLILLHYYTAINHDSYHWSYTGSANKILNLKANAEKSFKESIFIPLKQARIAKR